MLILYAEIICPSFPAPWYLSPEDCSYCLPSKLAPCLSICNSPASLFNYIINMLSFCGIVTSPSERLVYPVSVFICPSVLFFFLLFFLLSFPSSLPSFIILVRSVLGAMQDRPNTTRGHLDILGLHLPKICAVIKWDVLHSVPSYCMSFTSEQKFVNWDGGFSTNTQIYGFSKWIHSSDTLFGGRNKWGKGSEYPLGISPPWGCGYLLLKSCNSL